MKICFTSPELLLVEERCLDGEMRCARRAAEARARGDYTAATAQLRIKEQYAQLREKVRGRRGTDSPADRAQDETSDPHSEAQAENN